MHSEAHLFILFLSAVLLVASKSLHSDHQHGHFIDMQQSKAFVRPPPSWIVHEETVPVDEQLVSINEGEANEEHSTNESSLEESNLKPDIPNPRAKQNQKLKSALRTLGPLMLSLLRSASSNAHEYLEDRVLPAQIPSQKQVRLEMQKRYHGQYLPWYRYHKKLAPSLADATVTRDK